MRKIWIIGVVVVAVLGAIGFYAGLFSGETAAQESGQGEAAQSGGGGRRGGGGGFGGRGGGNFARPPMTVELATATRTAISEQITVVGNLVGDATVAVVPRTAGRLDAVYVRLGDRVGRGQRIAKIEDQELLEQVRQAEAALEVALATIRQREADLKLAETNVERSRNLFERQLLPKQTLDDNEARFQSAVAQLDLARAQNMQSRARLEELRINLANTTIISPVDGFVARRAADPGAFVSQNAPVVDVVDIRRVRLVANVVERDLNQLRSGDSANVSVDAYPGETFAGRIARVAPVLDPATRTASIEVEIPNPDFRLKPGMYARVGIITGSKKDALVVPTNAVVDLGGRRGVFQPQNGMAIFRTVQVGSEQRQFIEIIAGLKEGEQVITTGAAALRDGDQILLAGGGGSREGGARGVSRPDGEDGPSPAPGMRQPPAAGSVNPDYTGEGRRGRGEFPRQGGPAEGGFRRGGQPPPTPNP